MFGWITNQPNYWAIDTLAADGFAGFDARSAGINCFRVTTCAYSHLLNVWIESPTSLVFGMRNVVSETWALAADFTRRSHLDLLRYCPRSGTSPNEQRRILTHALILRDTHRHGQRFAAQSHAPHQAGWITRGCHGEGTKGWL